MSDKIKSVDFSGRDDHKALIEELKRNLQDLPELMQLIAQRKKIVYDSYIGAGFNTDQALELCKELELA